MLLPEDISFLTRIVKVMRKMQSETVTTENVTDMYKIDRSKLMTKINHLASAGLITFVSNKISLTECGWKIYSDREIRRQKWIIAIIIKYNRSINAQLEKLALQKLVNRVYIAPFSQNKFLYLKRFHSLITVIGTSSELKNFYADNPKERIKKLITKAKAMLAKVKKNIEKASPDNKYLAFKEIENCFSALKLATKALYLYNEERPFEFEDNLEFAIDFLKTFFPDQNENLSELKLLHQREVSLLTAYEIWNAVSDIIQLISDSLKAGGYCDGN